MTITSYTGGFVQTNGYLIETEHGAVAVDAPFGFWKFCEARNIKPTGLLLTHQHFDHVQDVASMQRAGVPVYAGADYSPDLVLDEGARLMGIPVTVAEFTIDHFLEDPLELAGLQIDIRHVPGHSPDSFVFHVALFQKLFGGDTLFAGSIGRSDLPGGDHELLLRGIRERLLTLPAETEVLPGHGPPTTIGQESATNPFLA